MNKLIPACIVVTVFAVGGIFLVLRNGASPVQQTNVTVLEGKQIIQIAAKGGYAPRLTTAKANMPTVLNMNTNGTFDCSIALTVPAVGYRDTLPTSGVTPIEIPPQPPGTTIKGVCSMGMYSFAVDFR